MRRKRFQRGSLQKINGAWVARWRQDGNRKGRVLGRVSQMTKAQAQSELAALVAPVNNAQSKPSDQMSFKRSLIVRGRRFHLASSITFGGI